MGKLKIGKRYTYKNHVYEIVNFGHMKLESNDWVDAVGYKRVLEDGDEEYEIEADTTTIYTRSRTMFEELFTPRTLEVGDVVIAYSMGKILREYLVDEVYDENNLVRYKFSTKVNSSESSSCRLITINFIDFNGRVYIAHPDEDISHINCVEYYYLSDRVRKIINLMDKIELIRNKLMNIHEAFGKIDITNFRNSDILDKYNSEITTLIEQIQKDGFIQWPQYKKQ